MRQIFGAEKVHPSPPQIMPAGSRGYRPRLRGTPTVAVAVETPVSGLLESMLLPPHGGGIMSMGQGLERIETQVLLRCIVRLC
jgi:hypothetical protein